MENIKQQLFETTEFKELARLSQGMVASQPVALRGVAGSLLAFVATRVFETRAGQILLIAEDQEAAEKLRDDCALLLGGHQVRLFAARPTHHAHLLDLSAPIAQIETLRSLVTVEPVLVIASPQAIVEFVPDPASFRSGLIELKTGDSFGFESLIERLTTLGFERKNFIEGYGDFAVRGGIVDVFPFVGEHPIRAEFWGDTVESIREFDVLSQRSIRGLQSASIVPSFSGDGDSNASRLSSTLFDYLAHGAAIILNIPEMIEREIDELFQEGAADLLTYDHLVALVAKFPRVIIQSVMIDVAATIVDFQTRPQPALNGSIAALLHESKKLLREGYRITLACDTATEVRRLSELIEEALTSPDEDGFSSDDDDNDVQKSKELSLSLANFEFIEEAVHSGFISRSAKHAVITEHELFGRLKRRGSGKRRRFKGFSHKELRQLKPGDYVVDAEHGIGTFVGLVKLSVGGTEQEVMKLQFLDEDVLYVNLNFIDRVQKYSSQEAHVPKLSKLGTAEWDRAKARAKKRIKDIAREIISLYARRKLEKGFPFSPDTHWQKEMEASFMYEDTPDQATATLDVKRDMESSSPMDRLVCGDVGYGKTEVAVRAAFKAVMDGKQVAVLVPTTILAMQHAQTFHDRTARYATRIECLTRFKSVKEQKKIIEGLRLGTVDIVIGTHRLISKDVGFKDLGLLIIDEEHRFGVTAKEKLRKMKAAVDTLALTATPIPRTLHFSLIGARDLSLITTPPRNRLPILTEIIGTDAHGKETHWRIIREAIVRELHRGGQVYVVHDRVSNIDAIAQQVKSHVPHARVHIAHGQMSGHELEKTMIDFLEKKYDVLVCTKIIESGLDIPSVNTIIINRADMFGLAELYQLRGRVGRSNTQAYAYLLTPPMSALPKSTLRRLQAIEEFTELGSGFNLAMRDLEIRGAGNLLGGEQSGFIMEMGFEMYERIVREAVDELREEEFEHVIDKERVTLSAMSPVHRAMVESDVEALIPEFYIESSMERLDVYRRLYAAGTHEELNTMREELKDRFGEYPEEVEHLFHVVELRRHASVAGFQKIELADKTLFFTLPSQEDEPFYGTTENPGVPFQRLMQLVSRSPSRMRLKQEGKLLKVSAALSAGIDPRSRLLEAIRIAEEVSTFIRGES